jgi:ribosomal protein S18 acetylase RimI-like enzyme
MIREYQKTDWPEVCRVFDLSKPCELATGGIAESFVPLAKDGPRIAQFANTTVLVWEETKSIRGFAGFNGSFIGWLFVEPDAFRKGIGRALLRQVVSSIADHPWLWSMKDNHAALALYLSEGFAIAEERATQNGGMRCTAVKLVLIRNVSATPARPTPGL